MSSNLGVMRPCLRALLLLAAMGCPVEEPDPCETTAPRAEGCPCNPGTCAEPLSCVQQTGDDVCECVAGSPGCPCAVGDACDEIAGALHACTDGICELGECDGADLQTDPSNCGTCGRACPDETVECRDGQCWAPQESECFSVAQALDCNAYCEAEGSFCNLGCWGTSAVDFFADDTCHPNLYLWSNQCDTPLEGDPAPVGARCCCAVVVE